MQSSAAGQAHPVIPIQPKPSKNASTTHQGANVRNDSPSPEIMQITAANPGPITQPKGEDERNANSQAKAASNLGSPWPPTQPSHAKNASVYAEPSL